MWKIILQIAAWTDAALCRVSGKTIDVTPAQDWPPSSPLSGEHSVSQGPNRRAEEEMR